MLLPACGVAVKDGNLSIDDKGSSIISVSRDGFKLNGNVTGVTLDETGLHIQYPNGSLSWQDDGFNVTHADGSIRVAEGAMVIKDKDGKTKTLDMTGEGAEYSAEGGASVRIGKKAVLPEEYPADKLPLPDGFELNATAELGSVRIVSGYVPGLSLEDAISYYQPTLMAGSSYSQDKKVESAVLRAKLNGLDVTVYLQDSVTADAINISIVLGK